MNRKVMRTTATISDSMHVPSQNWIVVPQHAIMHDAALYPNPQNFDPYRFVKNDNGVLKSNSRFSHPRTSFLYWGSARRAWYVHTRVPSVEFSHEVFRMFLILGSCAHQSRQVLYIDVSQDDSTPSFASLRV